MASSNDSSKGDHAEVSDTDADLAQISISEAWTQIAKGEKTAQALESHLTSLEKKIDDLLASFEESERAKVDEANSEASDSRSGDSNGGTETKA
ncbi:uncharacterized protein LY89DRAFT_680492 [Mollisia scopiformis]|uniref:Uncharacterized protein n=1 Tax=Mollisia scopiformis TaxID=149040 RepID=A0A194XQM6_MOLSC|nr:uncharacterized protein LY89DRAFT_680492 [Mollisia scopiformis]KUJ22359.1 hypothetical protein LY89DRAFT_680492 [Mollisia scopiformis]